MIYPPWNPRPEGMHEILDMTSETGARYLADKIRRAWAACGRSVTVEIVRSQINRRPVYLPRLRTPMRPLNGGGQ